MNCYDTVSRRLTHFSLADPNPDWFRRSRNAYFNPLSNERGIVMMMKALVAYADDHARKFESPLGHDYVLGPAWLKMLQGWRTLLNGDLGRLDGGLMDALAREVAMAAGFKEGEYDETATDDDDDDAGSGGVWGKP